MISKHKSTKLNSLNHWYVSQTIQLNICFVYKQLIDQFYFKQFKSANVFTQLKYQTFLLNPSIELSGPE